MRGIAESLATLGGARDRRAVLSFVTTSVLVFGVLRSTLWGLVGMPISPWLLLPAWLGHVAALGLLWTRFSPDAPRLALLALALESTGVGAMADNHFALEFVGVLALAARGRDASADAAVETLATVRLLSPLVLMHSGIAKLWTGLWDRGEFLAFMIGRGERFGAPFAWLIGDGEVARLAAYDPLRSGAGPYLVDGPMLPLAALGVVAVECLLPVGLFSGRLRQPVVRAMLVLVLALQVFAQEFGFATLFAFVIWSWAEDLEDARSLRRWTGGAAFLLMILLWLLDAFGAFGAGNL